MQWPIDQFTGRKDFNSAIDMMTNALGICDITYVMTNSWQEDAHYLQTVICKQCGPFINMRCA